MLRTVRALRYVTPLREGGSLPAIVEADDDGTYVLKFRGAGQGPKALVAEIIAGEIGRVLGLPVPEIAYAELDPALGRNEPDFEIKGLIERSPGLNLAVDFLPGSLSFDPIAAPRPEPSWAASVVWFDAFVANVDRTPRNTNILVWHKQLWLIDHGAALYYHHRWPEFEGRALDPFPAIKNHVLLIYATQAALAEADARARALLTPQVLREIVDAVPEAWLDVEEDGDDGPEAHREAYARFLSERLQGSRVFVEEAGNARAALV